MRINIQDARDCCGCTACAAVCPMGAITMQPNVMGFLYPVIDDSRCIDCSLCAKTCQFNDHYKRHKNYDSQVIYGIRHKDEKELEKSQSGAASWAIIEAFLQVPGSVYGAAFQTVYHVAHSKACSLDDAQKFRCSKYVQSDLRGVFTDVKNELKEGCRVLFFGTGCQIAGLKAAIPDKLQNELMTIDIVCHAGPSPAVWESYVRYVEDKNQNKVLSAAFRNKRFGWHSHIETFVLDNSTKEIESISFRKLFYDHVIVRPSCTKCYFTNMQRVGDMTICDFWGWEKYYSEWNDNKGVSVLMLNSERGREFFEELRKFILFKESSAEKCIQPQLQTPITANMQVIENAERIFAKKGYKGLARKYGNKNSIYLFKEAIRPILKALKLK